MKDPLQTIQSPYDTLGVKRGASKSDIEKALLEAFKRVPPNLAMAAYNILKNPIERAKFDLLEYNDEVLKQMRPCPLNGESLLHSDSRMSTALEWERQLKTQFPHPPLIHVLAILWYHWLLHEEKRFKNILAEATDLVTPVRTVGQERERGRNFPCPCGSGEKYKKCCGAPNGSLSHNNISKSSLLQSLNKAKGIDCSGKDGSTCSHSDCSWHQDCCSSAPQLEIMWEKTIAYWCAFKVTAYPDSDSVTVQAKEEIVGQLHDKLLNFRQQYAELLNNNGKSKINNNGSGLVGQYSELEQKLQLEKSLSMKISKAAVRTAKGKVCCGRMMLENMGLLNAMKSQIKEKNKGNPNNEILKGLIRELSDIPMIELLIDKLKYDEALKIIEQQSDEDRESEEICVLKCKALFKLGKQQAELKHMDDALVSWERALGCRFSGKLQKDIHNEIVTHSCAYAAVLSNSRPDDAVAVLEMALDLVKDKKIELVLGGVLFKSGKSNLEDAYNKVIIKGQDATPGLIAACEKAVKDIQRASQLGSDLAKENLDSARNFVETLKTRLPGEAQKLVDRANDAAKKQDWDQAINCLTEAIAKAGQKVPEQINKNLAVCYFNRGIERVNRVMDKMGQAAERHKQKIDYIIENCSPAPISGYLQCEHISPHLLVVSPERFKVYSFADGIKRILCPACVAILSDGPSQTTEELSMLQSGESDVAEAAELDSSDEHFRQQLIQVREVLSKLGHPVSAKKPRKSVTTNAHSAKTNPAQQSIAYQTQKKQNQTASVQKQKKRTTVKELLLVLFWILVALIIGAILSRFWS